MQDEKLFELHHPQIKGMINAALHHVLDTKSVDRCLVICEIAYRFGLNDGIDHALTRLGLPKEKPKETPNIAGERPKEQDQAGALHQQRDYRRYEKRDEGPHPR